MGSQLPNERFDQSTRKRLEGTCGWILDRSEFSEWVSPTVDNPGSSRVLWITGPAGFGKTILCASLVSHLSTTLDSPVAHYFFSSNANNDDDPYVAIRSWVSQLSSSHDDAFKIVYDAWECNTDQVASRATIKSILRELLETISGCTLIADGLDEIPFISSFLEAVMDAAMGTNTRILVVSRDEIEIRQGLTGRPQVNCTEYKIQLEDVRNDTKACSRSIVDRKLPNKGEDIRSGISETMAARCEGQFLWLEMQEETLRKGMSKKQLERAISDAPAGLERLYDQNWNKITAFREAERVRAFALLRWAAFAQRPLTVTEITEAVLINDEMDELMMDDLPDEVDDDYVETEIIGLCASLLEVKAQTPEQSVGLHTVQLKHFSVKQYLLSHLPLPSWISANERLQLSYEQMQSSLLAKLCLHYINLPAVWSDGTDEEQLRLGIPFREYASSFWHNHLKSSSESIAELAALTRRFFKRENPCWIAWRKWVESQNGVKLDSETVLPDPLYYAIRLGLNSIALDLIESDDLDLRGPIPSGRPVLIEACDSNGAIEIVKRLFEKGADVAVRDHTGWTCLLAASSSGHVEIVKLLLEMNADVSEHDNTKTTPLYFAARNGYVELAKILLEHGADVNAVQQQGWTPLCAASNENKYDVARLLIDHGADVNIANENGWTPVSVAACGGYTDIVKLLLDHGADSSIGNENGWTPISLAASNGHKEVVKLLLNQKQEIKTHDSSEGTPVSLANNQGYPETTNNGQSPLHLASSNGHVDTVKLLLSHGAEIDIGNGFGYTPLALASEAGNIEIVRTLLDHGASMSGSKHPNRYTPLILAAIAGHTEVARLLIQAGADLTPFSEDGWSALLIASYKGHTEIVRLLLDHGADRSAAHHEWTPLMYASWRDHPDVAQLLLEKGASPLEGATQGRSALSIAIKKGHNKVLELLVANFAEDSPAINELTPILIASKLGRIDAVKILLESARIRPEATDKLGRTALFMAARFGHPAVVQILLSDGRIDPDATDYYGSTALFAAVRNGHADTVALLLVAKGPSWHMQDGFGRSLEWWAERSGQSRILQLLREGTDTASSPVSGKDGALPEPLAQKFNPADAWCDCCTLSIPGMDYYGCELCDPTTLVICKDCFGMGFRCLDKSHELEYETSESVNS